MKKFIILLAGLGVAAAAVPASAAPSHGYAHAGYANAGYYQGGWRGMRARQSDLKNRIATGINTGALTRREAYRLEARFNELINIEARYRRTGGGLSRWERRDLDRRFDQLEHAVRAQKHDRQNRRPGRRY